MTTYLSSLWARIIGSDDEQEFLGALRPRSALRTPRHLPSTPTRSHLPAPRPEIKDTGKKSKQCPHYRKSFYFELPSGRISKSKNPHSAGGKGKGKRWVSISDIFRVEDLSPTLGKGHEEGDEQRNEVREKGFQVGKPGLERGKRVQKAAKVVGRNSVGGEKPRNGLPSSK